MQEKYIISRSTPYVTFAIMNVYVAGEGYTLPCGFILKEFCVIFPNGEYNHYLFKSPEDIKLTATDEKTIRWVTRKINNIAYYDGDLFIEQLALILYKLKDFTIFTYSPLVEKLIQNFLPTTVVINTQDMGQHLPKSLPNPHCFRQHSYRYCAKAKAIAIKDFIEREDSDSIYES